MRVLAVEATDCCRSRRRSQQIRSTRFVMPAACRSSTQILMRHNSANQLMSCAGAPGTRNMLDTRATHKCRRLTALLAPCNRTVKLWSTELAANLVTFRGHLFPVWDTAACPGGQYVASGSADRTARIWSTERAQALRLLVGAPFHLSLRPPFLPSVFLDAL